MTVGLVDVIRCGTVSRLVGVVHRDGVPAPRTPIASGPATSPPTTVTPNVSTPQATGRVSGARTVGTGIKVLGVVGNLRTIEDLRNAFAGLGPQVDLEGLDPDPGDFEVGHEITGIRRKFYVVKAYEIA